MTRHQKGAYIDLLMAQYNNGHLTLQQIKQLLGPADEHLWEETLKSKFLQDAAGNFFNEKLEEETLKRKKFCNRQKERIEKRWNKEGYHGITVEDTTVIPKIENENENRDLNGFKKKEEYEEKKDLSAQTKKPTYASLFDKVLKEEGIQLPEGFYEIILEWLKYKSEKGQIYKETGLKNLIIKIINDSGGDYDTARAMIFYSVSNNYAGLYKEKANGTGKTIAPATDKEIADILLKHFGNE